MCVLGIFAFHHIKIQALQFFGDRATGAFTNRTVIQFTDRRHFSGCAGEESFVSALDFITRNTFFDHFQA